MSAEPLDTLTPIVAMSRELPLPPIFHASAAIVHAPAETLHEYLADQAVHEQDARVTSNHTIADPSTIRRFVMTFPHSDRRHPLGRGFANRYPANAAYTRLERASNTIGRG